MPGVLIPGIAVLWVGPFEIGYAQQLIQHIFRDLMIDAVLCENDLFLSREMDHLVNKRWRTGDHDVCTRLLFQMPKPQRAVHGWSDPQGAGEELARIVVLLEQPIGLLEDGQFR